MATINNLYVQVVDEDWEDDVSSTSHPVEKGIDITDTIRPKPVVLAISGNIVNYGTTKADTVLSKLKELKTAGSLITYVGRRTMSGLQIQAFKTSHPNTIWGGCKFEMELKEVRIAKSAYTEPKTSKIPAWANPFKVGMKVVFKGGNVYVASDSKKASAKRSRCTCEVTKISLQSWSIHKYHLVGGSGSNRVYGWVDTSTIEGIASSTKPTTNGGEQQLTTAEIKASIAGSSPMASKNALAKVTPVPVYHTVKGGDTMYKLVNMVYKNLGTSEKFIRENNPDAVKLVKSAKTGNYTYELTVGARILVGHKKGS